MKIALLSTGFRQGGKEATGITLRDFAKELTRTGNEVTIIAERRGEFNRREEINGIHIYRIGGFKFLTFYNRIFGHALGVRRMQRSLKKEFDIIHSFSSAPVLVLRGLSSKLFSRKSIVIHTLKSYSRAKLGKFFYGLLNFADKVTVPTMVFADMLIKNGVHRNKIKVIRSHIDTKKFTPKNKSLLKKRYGYKDKKIIFYYGGMWDLKGVDYLIKVIPKVIKKNPNVKFVFAPRNIDSTTKEYPKTFTEQGLKDYTEVILYDIGIVDYVNLADIIVLPYVTLVRTEGNPSCLLEAMACKTPVVTTDLPELKEIVKNREDVLMARPKDVESLAKNINELLRNHKLYKKLANNAYKKSKDFDIRLITKKFIDLYKELMITK